MNEGTGCMGWGMGAGRGEPSSIFLVQFGSVMGGGMSISTIQTVPSGEMKLAA